MAGLSSKARIIRQTKTDSSVRRTRTLSLDLEHLQGLAGRSAHIPSTLIYIQDSASVITRTSRNNRAGLGRRWGLTRTYGGGNQGCAMQLPCSRVIRGRGRGDGAEIVRAYCCLHLPVSKRDLYLRGISNKSIRVKVFDTAPRSHYFRLP